jgi:hypothetical protein
MVIPEKVRHKDLKQKYGRIHAITKFNIIVAYKNYKESFNLADIVTNPKYYKIKVWTGVSWEKVKENFNYE